MRGTKSRTGNRRYRRNRAIVLAKSDVCHLCGKPGADTADHVVPYAYGGTDDVSNLRPAHKRCNSKRGKKSIEESGILRTSFEW